MKIRIADQIYEIDTETLYAWIRLGRVPLDASVCSETLSQGRWQSVRELDLVRNLWGLDEDLTDTKGEKAATTEEELRVEQKFLAYQKRRPTVTLALLTVNIIIFLLLDQFTGRSKDPQTLIQFGAYSYRLIVEGGEYWRLLTNTFLHGGELHLVLNMGLLFIVGSLLEGLYGRWRFLILYLISAIGGSLASLPFVQDAPGVGASGAIFGLMGVVVAIGIRHKEQLPRRRGQIFGLRLLPFIAIDVLLGFVFPQINNAAHLGGLVTGFIFAMILVPEIYTNRERETKAVTAFATALFGLVIASGAITVWHYFTDSADVVQKRMGTAFRLPSAEDLPAAIKRYEKEIRKRGYNRRAYAVLERLYLEALKNYPDQPSWRHKLRKFYERALQEDAENPVWHYNLLQVYQATVLGQPEEEAELEDYIKMCEKVARKQGYYESLYHNLEFFYTRAKELAPQEGKAWARKLEALYKEAVEKDPNSGTWSNNLAWLYVEQQTNSSKAVALALNAVKQRPKEKNFLDTLAWVYLQNGQYRKSLRAFEQVFAIPGENEDDLKAQESSWKGLTALVQTEVSAPKLQELDRAFLKFYERLSLTFTDDAEAQAKLDAIFDLFLQVHRRE
ncbi:MAG: rhomboid family intramembrane serine protease [Candidatus Poribacteria bacterium]|nr:rhomboid family intramembrane serine protease [Candidatus Poribacteria bacterium]